MKILIIGSGGREHALAWSIFDSPLCDELIIAPGNPGIAQLGRCEAVSAEDTAALVELAKNEAADLVVVGPEVPLVNGLADDLIAADIPVFGPHAAAARLEGSKAFARDFCERHNIPQPKWQNFTKPEAATAFAAELNGYCVIKADGLAAGKGVVICSNLKEAEQAIIELLGGRFGLASQEILVEERITGPELSAFALVDGKSVLWLASAQDYKRAFDGDAGPNTGGMGAVSPSPYETDVLRDQIMSTIITPVAKGMAAEGCPYNGVLYAGLMLTEDGPKVIEFNCRFGDPEAQVVLPRLKSDFLSAALTVVEGGLENFDLRWIDQTAVTVVMAADGYPGSYQKGQPIHGADQLETADGSLIFHAGTESANDGQLISAGGRVLAVTALGNDRQLARSEAYAAVKTIFWPDAMFRTDIAAD